MRRELKIKLARLRAKMQAALTPLDPDQKDERLAKARLDDDYFNQVYLPYLCDMETPDFHHEISGAFDLRTNEVQAEADPRGFGKTVRSQTRQIKEICLATRQLILGISASEEMIEDLVEPIKVNIAENARIIQDFGQLVTGGSPTDFKTTHGVKFIGKGRGQKIRGLHPDLIVLDDVEDDVQAKDRKRVDALLNWLWEVLYPAMVPETAGGSTLIVIGTLLARKSMLARLLDKNEHPHVLGTVRRALMTDEHGREYSLWPARFPVEKLKRKKRDMGSRRFNKEYQNDPRDEDSVFQESWFLGFHASELQELGIKKNKAT